MKMRFRSRGHRRLRGSRSPTHWVPSGTFGIENAVTAGTITSSVLASSTISTGATAAQIDNNRATVLRIRGTVLFRNTSATGIGLITCGIIEVPVTGAGVVDVTDFDPTVTNNQLKPWMWLGACYVFANNVNTNGESSHQFDIDVKSKRVLSQSAVTFITIYTAVVAGATVSIVHNLRTLVGRLG